MEVHHERILLYQLSIQMAVLSGADDWNALQAYGESKQDWLSDFLELPNRIPSHSMFKFLMREYYLNDRMQVSAIDIKKSLMRNKGFRLHS